MIVDSHTHLNLEDGETFKDSLRRHLKDMNKNEVDYAILIPGTELGSDTADLETILGLIKNEPRLFSLGTLNIFRDKKPVLNKLDKLFEEKRIVGIKLFPGHHPFYPTDKRLIPVYELCIKHDLPVMIHTGILPKDTECAKYNDPKHVIKVAKNFPILKIVIAHYFLPKVEYCFEITKPFRNIYYDTSALADDAVVKMTGLQKIKKVLAETVKEKPENLLFGTDYNAFGFKEHIDLINSLEITDVQKEKIFWRNAQKLFKLELNWRD